MFIPQRFKSGETLKTDIGPKLNQMVDFMKSLVVNGDKSTIAVKHLPGGSFISCLINPGGGGGGGGSSTYTGPFAVTKKDDTHVTVATGTVVLGTTIESVVTADKEVTAMGYIYLDISYSSGYVISIESETFFPAQSNTNLYILLASVIVDDSKISAIIQSQYGIHYVAGRVV